MSRKNIRLAVLSGIATAVIGSVVAVLINFATNGNGGVLIWVAVVLSSIISGVVPHVHEITEQLRVGSSLRRFILGCCICLMLPLLVSSDISSQLRSPREADIADPYPPRGDIEERAALEKDRPLPGVINPNPVNPDSIAVAARLTMAIRDAGIIPDHVTVESESLGTGESPLEFHIGQGAFRAFAGLRVAEQSFDLRIEALWPGQMPFVGGCEPQPDIGDYCEETTSEDGTYVMYNVNWDPSTGYVEGEEVLLARSGGAQVMVGQSASSDHQFESILSSEQMVNMALVIAKNLSDTHQ